MISTVVLVLAIAAAFYAIAIYNRLVRLKNLIKNSYAQIDVQLKRRYDLIPNLVETAKAYLQHERQTLEAVVLARNQAYGAAQAVAKNIDNPEQFKALMQAEGQLGQAMGKLMVVMESYPDLKANATMKQMMEELTTTENKIAYARQAYNDAVMDYNNQREVFPNSFVASSFHFAEATSFEVTEASQKENIKVSFSS